MTRARITITMDFHPATAAVTRVLALVKEAGYIYGIRSFEVALELEGQPVEVSDQYTHLCIYCLRRVRQSGEHWLDHDGYVNCGQGDSPYHAVEGGHGVTTDSMVKRCVHCGDRIRVVRSRWKSIEPGYETYTCGPGPGDHEPGGNDEA